MKKTLILTLAILMLIVLSIGCSGGNSTGTLPRGSEMSLYDFELLIASQPLGAFVWSSSAFSLVHGYGEKNIYVDTTITNNTKADIRLHSLTLAFAAWDGWDDMQQLICSQGVSFDSYINRIILAGLNLEIPAGGSIEINRENAGKYGVTSVSGIGTYHDEYIGYGIAIVASCMDYSGNSWTNPYLDTFNDAFSKGGPFDEGMTITIVG